MDDYAGWLAWRLPNQHIYCGVYGLYPCAGREDFNAQFELQRKSQLFPIKKEKLVFFLSLGCHETIGQWATQEKNGQQLGYEKKNLK